MTDIEKIEPRTYRIGREFNAGSALEEVCNTNTSRPYPVVKVGVRNAVLSEDGEALLRRLRAYCEREGSGMSTLIDTIQKLPAHGKEYYDVLLAMTEEEKNAYYAERKAAARWSR